LAKSKRAKEYSSIFGKYLKEKILNKYGSIENFSNIVNISRQTLYDYIRGKSFPSIDKFIDLCEKLESTPSNMLMPILKQRIPPPEGDLIDFYNILQNTYKSTTYKDLAKIMILGLDFLQLGKQIHGSEDPVENLMKFRDALKAKLT
jgi:transcriptional regulator with XRE-family HTH domain